VVLSRRNVVHCLAASMDRPPWDSRLRPLVEVGQGGYTGYDSIFRFKGREAPAIVVTDIDELEAEGRWSDIEDVRSLLYIAATRSLSRVVVLAHESWREKLPWGPMDAMGLDSADTVARREECEPVDGPTE
jgi:hypothetical protein